MATVAGTVPEAQAEVVAETFVVTIQGTEDSYQLKALAESLAALPIKLTEPQAGAAAKTFVTAMLGTKNSLL